MTKPKKRAQRVSARVLWIAPVILLVLLAPLVVAAADWAAAVRLAQSNATDLALGRTGLRFLGWDWQPPRRDPGIIGFRIEEPPRSGSYAGYTHATRVEVVRAWQPLLPFLSGGVTQVRGRATAAMLKSRDGQWMPITVE